MPHLNFVLLYVADPLCSAEFYSNILGRKPVESSPGFSMFVLDGGLKLGLWKRQDVEPSPEGAPGSVELIFSEESDQQVDERFADWTGKGIVIAQTPNRMEFGYTFVALDPDGHRLRVYKLAP
jgi:catechol 2,3-dioxygenase-like lactoylglutathione lyase family enzyme